MSLEKERSRDQRARLTCSGPGDDSNVVPLGGHRGRLLVIEPFAKLSIGPILDEAGLELEVLFSGQQLAVRIMIKVLVGREEI